VEKNLTPEDLKDFNRHNQVEVGGDDMQQSGGSATTFIHNVKLSEPKLAQQTDIE
jgi:hypothetical protein